MALRKRNGVYYIDITVGGRRIRQATGTKSKSIAKEIHNQVEAEIIRVARLGEKPRHSWKEGVERYLLEMQHKKTIRSDIIHLRWVSSFLSNLMLDEITRDKIDEIKQAKLETGVKNSTVNHLLQVIGAVLRRARDDWEWLEKIPKIRKLKKPPRRERFLAPEEVWRLLVELPGHTRAMFYFSLMTGLRKSNVMGLRWSQVDWQHKLVKLPADEMKGESPICVPLNEEAMFILEECRGKHAEWVFAYSKTVKGEVVTDRVYEVTTAAWYKALKRARIKDFKWHDSRHTWASTHAQKGTPILALQKMGGWKSLRMVEVYAHLNVEHIVAYAGNVNLRDESRRDKLKIQGTNRSQDNTSGDAALH